MRKQKPTAPRSKKNKPKLLSPWQRYRKRAGLFAVIFALAGGFFIFKSFAATSYTLLYYGLNADASPTSLILRDASGATQTIASSPAFIADGDIGTNTTNVVYTGDNGGIVSQIHVVDPATKADRVLINLPGNEDFPRISPDGQLVSFEYSTSSNPQVHVIDIVGINGDNLRQLILPGIMSDVSGAAWSPDGTRLAFSGCNTTNCGLWTINADGTNLAHVAGATTSNYVPPAWTPDGKYLVFDTYMPGTPNSQIWASDLHGGMAKLTSDTTTHGAFHPTISNDWRLFYSSGSITGSSDIKSISLSNLSSVSTIVGSAMQPTVLHTGTVTAPPSAFLNAFHNSCPPALFIGVRGSGETEGDNGGLGGPEYYTSVAFSKQIPGAEIEHVDYPSIAVLYGGLDYGYDYIASELNGQTKLNDLITAFRARCISAPIVLSGYSQGAHVAADVYQSLSPKVAKQIAAVVLYGDPRFYGGQKGGVNQGTFDSSLNGVFKLSQDAPKKDTVPRKFTGSNPGGLVHSYCLKGDPVCQSEAGNILFCYQNIGLCPHLHYVGVGYANQGGQWAADRAKAWH